MQFYNDQFKVTIRIQQDNVPWLPISAVSLGSALNGWVQEMFFYRFSMEHSYAVDYIKLKKHPLPSKTNKNEENMVQS